MRIQTQGRVFEGTALQIVREMREGSFRAGSTLRDYVTATVKLAEMMDERIVVVGDTDEELAASLLAELLRVRLVQVVP